MRTLLFDVQKLVLNAVLGIRSSFIHIKMFDVCLSEYVFRSNRDVIVSEVNEISMIVLCVRVV